MQRKKPLNNGKKPALKQIHKSFTEKPSQIRQQIGESLGITQSIVFAIIRGDRVCSQAEREAIAKIYGRDVSEIAWAEKK